MIDLRSDICSAPTDEMWDAMRAARLGWATLGEDESVNALEQRGAELLGKQAAVLVADVLARQPRRAARADAARRPRRPGRERAHPSRTRATG